MPFRAIFSAIVASVTVLAAPTIYLAGDSTMAASGGGDGVTGGWGTYLPNYVSLAVVNNAIGGRSARSFTREGRFTAMANNVKSGDYVVIEFGHNDGGSLTPTDNGRTDCNPVNNNYATTCQTVYKYVVSLERYHMLTFALVVCPRRFSPTTPTLSTQQSYSSLRAPMLFSLPPLPTIHGKVAPSAIVQTASCNMFATQLRPLVQHLSTMGYIRPNSSKRLVLRR